MTVTVGVALSSSRSRRELRLSLSVGVERVDRDAFAGRPTEGRFAPIAPCVSRASRSSRGLCTSPCSLAGLAQVTTRALSRKSKVANELWGRLTRGRKQNLRRQGVRRKPHHTVEPAAFFPAAGGGSLPSRQILYDYFDATGDHLLKQIKNLSATAATISQFDYTYRPDRAIGTWTVDQGSGSSAWTFGYDASRQLTSAERHAGATLLAAQYYGYDKAGNRVQVGTGLPAGTAPKNYDVNTLNQLLSERDHGPTTFAGTVNEAATVKVKVNGQPVNGQPAKVMSTGGVAPFRFEALVDLAVGANTVEVKATDGNDNVATKTYSVTTTGTSKTYEYDLNGNLRYEKLPGGTVVRELRWDQQNRLVRELHGTHESVYEYDGESRRVRIRELAGGAETKNETFVWCRGTICQKRSGSTIVRSYFHDGFEETSTNDYFYTRDHLSSVREVVGSDGTTVASRLSYDPWGKITETGAGALSDFAFTGHHADRPTELSLTWFRGYDPQLGRWLSEDPISLAGGLNLYGYVDNDPANSIDSDGLQVCPPTPKPPSNRDNLKKCKKAAKGGFDDWDNFCRGLPDYEPGQYQSPRTRCFDQSMRTKTVKSNWCIGVFGT